MTTCNGQIELRTMELLHNIRLIHFLRDFPFHFSQILKCNSQETRMF